MKKDGVNAAFGMVTEELDSVISKCQEEVKGKTDAGKFDEAEAALQICRGLQTFRGKISELRAEWDMMGFRRKPEFAPVAPTARCRQTGGRNPTQKLAVTFEDGTRFDYPIAANTLTAVIEKVGVERVKQIGLTVSGVPLVSRSNPRNLNSRKCQGHYVMTPTATDHKARQIKEIARQLGIKLRVKVVPR